MLVTSAIYAPVGFGARILAMLCHNIKQFLFLFVQRFVVRITKPEDHVRPLGGISNRLFGGEYILVGVVLCRVRQSLE